MKPPRLGSWFIAVACLALLASSLGLAAPHPLYDSPEAPRFEGPLDRLVEPKLKALGLQPALCSDAVFLRRVYIDLTGSLPSAAEAKAFIQDPDRANKRRVLIDTLLTSPEFDDYMAMRWGDVLRIKAEFPINLWPDAAQAYHRWVRASLAANKPYDVFVRELLTSSGSNFRDGEVNFYRAMQNRSPEGIAASVALTFMGLRLETLPPAQRAGLALCFSQVGFKPTGEWKEEHVFWDPHGSSTLAGANAPGRAALLTPAGQVPERAAMTLPKTAATEVPLCALMPDGTELLLPPDRDPREVFADWLLRPENPWFARCMANRLWYWLLGRGIVHEPDDFRADNPPSNPALLDALAREFAASRYDLRQLCRQITNTATYQLSSVATLRTPEAEANFAAYPLRRLDAEVLIDAVNKITGTTSLYTSAIPEPFTYIPEDQPAIALADGSITSPFLALFGRSARATGLESERINKPMPAQAMHMLNSSHIQRKLEQGPALRELFATHRKNRELVELVYLTILSRYPGEEEVAIFEAYGKTSAAGKVGKGSEAAKPGPSAKPQGKPKAQGQSNPYQRLQQRDWQDLAWALLNSTEFLHRH